MASANIQLSGQSSNRDAYRATFLRHVHRLLQLGYESLIPTAYTKAEEDDITGELCKRMKVLTEEQPSEQWMSRYSVHDQDPVNDVVNPETGKVRRGKRRPKLDIRLVGKARVPNTRFCIEAKRLYRSGSITEYTDEEGLGAFVAEYYAKYDDAAGMLGYVQSDSIAHWVEKLENSLAEEASLEKGSRGEIWNLSSFPKGPPSTYLSFHHRTKSGRKLGVFHAFFLFC
ncbi:MAG TPA: hypothetical protein VN578_21345 [Candidatus Binatia bacterium]|nr:hypothetical protein [Candidatus Binatia bacterium]